MDDGWELIGLIVTTVAAVAAVAFAVPAAAEWLRKKPPSTADRALLRIWPDVTRSVKRRRRDQPPPPRRPRKSVATRARR